MTTIRDQAAIICAVLASGTCLTERDVAEELGFSARAARLADHMTSAVRTVGGPLKFDAHCFDSEAADLLWRGFLPRDVRLMSAIADGDGLK